MKKTYTEPQLEIEVSMVQMLDTLITSDPGSLDFDWYDWEVTV